MRIITIPAPLMSAIGDIGAFFAREATASTTLRDIDQTTSTPVHNGTAPDAMRPSGALPH